MQRAIAGALFFVVVVACGPSAPPEADAGVDAAPDGGDPCGACDDGVFCNGAEACDARGLACLPGTPPCAVAVCDEGMDRCAICDRDGDGAPGAPCGGLDCDDDDPARYPGNVELCDADDEDCDPATIGERDADSDLATSDACCNGSLCGDDCDDSLAGVHPAEAESCDTLDNDCDGTVDERVLLVFYRDEDGDLHGSAESVEACAAAGVFTATVGDDCDDDEPTRHPGSPEACNRVADDDCDATTRPHDGDGDGEDAQSCGGLDCNDANGAIWSTSPDTCDPINPSFCGEAPLEDVDRDGHLAIGDPCSGGPLGAAARDDCDETRATTYSGAPETCNLHDDDCVPATLGPVDADGDGALASECCAPRADGTYDCAGDDCEGAIASIRPGATETCNGRDDDCDWMRDDTLVGCSAADPDANGVQCDGALCPFPSNCCLTVGPGGTSSVSCTTSCAGVRIRCDGAEDCGAGQVCCLMGGSTACAASCPAAQQICNDHLDCAVGRGCSSTTFPRTAIPIRVCVP